MNPLADGRWHRMHPATPILCGGVAFIAIVGIVFANLRERLVDWIARVPDDVQQGDPVDAIVQHGWTLWAALGALVFIALIVVWYRVTWQMTEFRVTSDAVELRSGVLNRQSRQARLDRIQGVNVHRTLFARLFGAARLEIVVAGHDANLHLQYLGSAAAEELRREILGLSRSVQAAEASAGEPGSAVDALLRDRADELLNPADLHPDAAPPGSVIKVHPGRLIGSIILSPVTIVLIAVIVWLIVEVSLGHYFLLVAVVPSLFGMFTGYSRRFSRLARYTISGSADGVRVGYGLLSTSSETIPTGRIHAVELTQPVLWRPFGWWTIRINRAGRSKQRGQAENASVVLPVGSLADVERVLPLLLPVVGREALRELVAATARFSDRTDRARTDRARADRARAARAQDPFSRAPRKAAWLHPFSWRRIGYAFAGDALALRGGYLVRRLVFVPLARVQSVAIRQGPLQRMLGLAGLHVHVVDGFVRPRLRAIGVAAGAALFDQLAHSAVILASRDVRR